MPILAAAADPHSWCDLMGIDVETSNATASLGFYNNALNLFGAKAAKPSIALSSNELCINMEIIAGVMFIGSSSANGSSSDWRKSLTINNTAGYPIFSIGYLNSGSYADTTNKLKFFIWDGTATGTLLNTVNLNTNIVPEVTDDTVRSYGTKLQFYIKIDTVTPANSVATLFIDGVQYLDLSGASLHLASALSFGTLLLGPTYTTNPSALGATRLAIIIASLVVADYKDFSLYAAPYKASALGSINDFTGVLANITSWLQDKLYFSTAVEVGATVEFVLSIPSTGYAYLAASTTALYTPKKVSTYLGGRYIQAGGVSITYTVTLYSGTTQISDPVSVVVLANESDDQYLVDFAGAITTSLATSQPLTQAELGALRVRITLVGV